MSDEEIRNLCKQLIACRDDAEVHILAERLRQLVHESIQEARSQIRVLPILNRSAERKTDKSKPTLKGQTGKAAD